MLGSLPTNHVRYVITASKYCISEYKAFLKKEKIFGECLLVGMKPFFDTLRSEEKDPGLMNDQDLFNVGEVLVEQGYLVDNTLQ